MGAVQEDNKAIVRRFFQQVWNERRLDLMDELYTEDFQLNALWQNHALGGSGTAAKGEARAAIGRWLDGFPDLHVSVEEQVAEGDFVVCRHLAVGTHNQDFMGLAKTGKVAEISGITITRVQGDKIAETWTLWDAAGMLMQLGIVPRPPDLGPPEDTAAAWAAEKSLLGGGDAEQSKRVVQEFYRELWTEGKLDVADELFASGFIGHAPGNTLTRGPAGVKELVAKWREGIPDMVLEIHAQYAEGSRCATRFTGSGTHAGTFLGVPATNKQVKMSGIAITRVLDGKVVSDWGEFDVIGMLQQLGVIPGPPDSQPAPD